MQATTPEQAVDLFATYLSEGDLPAALALYEDDAAFLPDPACVVSGGAAVQAGLGGFFALRPTLSPGDRRVVISGDTALVIHEWRLHGTLPDGTLLEQSGRAVDVLRRQLNGNWMFVIDNPWGEAVLENQSRSSAT